jgi:hypothetical protein
VTIARRACWLLSSALLWTSACSGKTAPALRDVGGSGTAAIGNDAAGSGPGSQTNGGDGFSNPAPGTVPLSMGRPGDAVTSACVGQTQGAQEVEVDMYIMLDRSGSMLDATGAGPTKWDAIRMALTSFVQDPQSNGLGVGLQYFPLGVPGVPETCLVDRDCGPSGGVCSAKACRPSLFGSSTFKQCLSDADCPVNSPGCVPFGVCSNDDTLACFDVGGSCQSNGVNTGDCQPYSGECTGYGSCVNADYAKPAVPIALLPDNAAALATSLAGEKPIGLTPTPAALSGAIAQATQHATQNPDHRVIAVLATDGTPTQCLPSTVTTDAQAITATAKIASQGFAATPSIPTYVIGVFAPDDKNAMANLTQLAVAGGTKSAFIVDQSQDVTQQLISALSTIRSGSLACEYALPTSPAGQTLDFTQVNVQFTMSDQTTKTLLYVAKSTQCTKAALGWFYDVDPSTGATPTKIRVCQSTCDTLRAASNATIQIRLGCATQSPE